MGKFKSALVRPCKRGIFKISWIMFRPVYEGEFLLIKVIWCSVKVLLRPSSWGFKTSGLLRALRWDVWRFISRGIKTTANYRFRVTTLLDENRLFCTFSVFYQNLVLGLRQSLEHSRVSLKVNVYRYTFRGMQASCLLCLS